MNKPRAIRWLEEETGADIDWDETSLPDPPEYVAVHITLELAAGLRDRAFAAHLTLDELVDQLLRNHLDCIHG